MAAMFFLMLQLFLTNSSFNDFSESDTLPSMKGQPLSDKNITPEGEIVASSKEN
jgi:hypothetical protein